MIVWSGSGHIKVFMGLSLICEAFITRWKTSSLVSVNVIVCAKCVVCVLCVLVCVRVRLCVWCGVCVCVVCVCACVCVCVCVCMGVCGVSRFTGSVLFLQWVSILVFLMARRTDFPIYCLLPPPFLTIPRNS